MSLAAIFPGQGSQSVGMGSGFYAQSEVARALFNAADSVLGFSLSELCFKGPIEQLTLTQNAQPALLTVSTIAFRLSGIKPAAAAGHSLGEYSALVAAGAIDFSDAVRLVHQRGKYMQQAVEPGAGKMVAVMGSEEGEIRTAIDSLPGGIAEIANLNCPGQIVVAGDNLGIDGFVAALSAKGGKCIPLNVSAPFHCSLMKPAADKLAADLAKVAFKDPIFPVYANVTAKIIRSGAEARGLLEQQVCGTVRWTDLMQNMIREYSITQAVEFGPGKVLGKLLKRIDKSVTALEVADPASLEGIKALKSA